MAETIIRFENVTKQYDDDPPILDNVSFEMERGKFYTLLGPSGCGKTTILRLIAGLIEATSGKIYINGKLVNNVPANKRQVNTVFQDYALFPHLNVYENVAFGLRIKKLNKREIDRKVKEALRFVNLEGFENREIHGMSGGQKQRVAIARALITKSPILIFDDSLSAVDTETELAIRNALKQRAQRATTFLISHRVSSLSSADLILVLEDGEIVERGTHEELMALGGTYKRIWQIQNRLEAEAAAQKEGD